MYSGKIFCIGFHKTGTTSLGTALEMLGYRVAGPSHQRDRNIAKKLHRIIESEVPRYDAFQDNPWPILYKELDKLYPGSKFILTIRDPAHWINSVCKHFGYQETPMRRLIYGKEYGCPVGNEEHYVKIYISHNDEVIKYFENRSDLLVLDLESGDGWEKLCTFLEADIPDSPFPAANTSANRESRGSIQKYMHRSFEIIRNLIGR